MEELAELQQAISKNIRYGAEDTLYNIIEEIADVTICMNWLVDILGIEQLDIAKAMDIKMMRERDRLDTENLIKKK